MGLWCRMSHSLSQSPHLLQRAAEVHVQRWNHAKPNLICKDGSADMFVKKGMVEYLPMVNFQGFSVFEAAHRTMELWAAAPWSRQALSD